MKRSLIAVVVLAMGLFTVSCASQGYNTQKGAAIGGAAGALMGMLLGAVIGNARDQDEWNARTAASDARPRDYARPSPAPEGPPGEWVTVPGQWSGGKWVPSHRVWVPVNP
jgi:surface antigen